ncbi:hypothetical protein R3P38DRAFT_3219028 [Favolaschia claudopus]|uniref:Uncharacterized protein n=1 Tax=Favolaschia claudopus TaxID=2862362 RepID=A0AAW0A2H9_9AGAR
MSDEDIDMHLNVPTAVAPEPPEPGPSTPGKKTSPPIGAMNLEQCRAEVAALRSSIEYWKQTAHIETTGRRKAEAATLGFDERVQQEVLKHVEKLEADIGKHYASQAKEEGAKYEEFVGNLREELEATRTAHNNLIVDAQHHIAQQANRHEQTIKNLEEAHQAELAKKTAEIQAVFAEAMKHPSAPGPPAEEPAINPGRPKMVPEFVTKSTKSNRRSKAVIENISRDTVPTLAVRSNLDGSSAPAASGSATHPTSLPPGVIPVEDMDQATYTTFVNNVRHVVQDMNLEVRKSRSGGSTERKPGGGKNGLPGNLADEMRKQKEKIKEWEHHTYLFGLREVWRVHYKKDRYVEFGDYVPADSNVVAACNDGGAGPDPSNYTLDFQKGFMTSLWNKQVLTKWTDAFLAARAECPLKWGLPDVTRGYIMGWFYEALKQSQESWASWKPRFLYLENRLETEQEVEARMDSKLKTIKRRAGDASIKTQKYGRRDRGITKTIKFKTKKGELDINEWIFLRDFLRRLGRNGMSSEDQGVVEVQGEARIETIYYVRLCAWRAPRIADYMAIIDRVSPMRAGALRRIRTDEAGDSDAPKELPLTFYNDEWLAARKEDDAQYEDEVLKVDRAAFELLDLATLRS